MRAVNSTPAPSPLPRDPSALASAETQQFYPPKIRYFILTENGQPKRFTAIYCNGRSLDYSLSLSRSMIRHKSRATKHEFEFPKMSTVDNAGDDVADDADDADETDKN